MGEVCQRCHVSVPPTLAAELASGAGTAEDGFVVNCPNVKVHTSLSEEQCFKKLEINTNANAVNFNPSNGKCALKKCSDLCSDRNTNEYPWGRWDAYVEPCGKYVN